MHSSSDRALNQAAPVNAPVASSFQFGQLCRRVTEQRRSAMKILLLFTAICCTSLVKGQVATNRPPIIAVQGKDKVMSLNQLMKVASDTVRTNNSRFPLTNSYSQVVFGDFRTNRIATVYYFDATKTGFLPVWVHFDAEFKATFQQMRCGLVDGIQK